MITEIDSLIYQAEAEYLTQADLGIYKSQILYLAERLKIYELLRAQEADLFQYVVNQIANNFPEAPETKVEQALRHWILVIRYCSMAMLSNDANYLQHRILEWLPEQIAAHELHDLEQNLYTYLHKRLKKTLGNDFGIFQPFLEQSKDILLSKAKAIA